MKSKLREEFIELIRAHEIAHTEHQDAVRELNKLKPIEFNPTLKEDMLYKACRANMTGGKLEGFVTALILIVGNKK